jgi:hypothetical protein
MKEGTHAGGGICAWHGAPGKGHVLKGYALGGYCWLAQIYKRGYCYIIM